MGSQPGLEMVMRRTLVLAMLLSTATLALECDAIGAETCDALWQRISADSKLPSALDKAKAMEQQGKACKDDMASVVRLANFYIEGKQFDRAEAVVSSALKEQPSSPELKDRAAFIAFSKGDIATARALASDLIQRHSSLASPYFTLARIEMQQKNWANALQYDRKAYELSGEALVLLHVTAELHQLDHHEDAVNTAYRALKENPSLISHKLGIDEAIYSLGALGRFDEATQLAKRRMAADKNWRQDTAFVQAARKLKIIK